VFTQTKGQGRKAHAVLEKDALHGKFMGCHWDLAQLGGKELHMWDGGRWNFEEKLQAGTSGETVKQLKALLASFQRRCEW